MKNSVSSGSLPCVLEGSALRTHIDLSAPDHALWSYSNPALLQHSLYLTLVRELALKCNHPYPSLLQYILIYVCTHTGQGDPDQQQDCMVSSNVLKQKNLCSVLLAGVQPYIQPRFSSSFRNPNRPPIWDRGKAVAKLSPTSAWAR